MFLAVSHNMGRDSYRTFSPEMYSSLSSPLGQHGIGELRYKIYWNFSIFV